mgnify:CR=1 FL=1
MLKVTAHVGEALLLGREEERRDALVRLEQVLVLAPFGLRAK